MHSPSSGLGASPVRQLRSLGSSVPKGLSEAILEAVRERLQSMVFSVSAEEESNSMIPTLKVEDLKQVLAVKPC